MKLRRTFAVGLAAAFLVGACGATTATPTAAPASSGEATPATSAAAGPSGFSLVVPEQSGPKSLNPDWQDDVGGYNSSGNIYSSLVILDWGIIKGTNAYGDLAESWTTSPDAKVFTFKLRPNVKWHDGTPFTSADVLYTYQTIVDQKYPLSAYLKGASFSAPDDQTFVITLETSNASFIPLLAQAGNWYGKILPKHIYDGTDWSTNPANAKPVGTGPYKFVDWKQDDQVTLEANPDYFKGRPVADQLIFKVVSDNQVAIEAFNANEYPYLPSQFVTSYEEISRRMQDTAGDVRVIETPSIYGRDLWFNLAVKPLDDPKVREAIAYAINRDQISELGFRGLWTPAYTAGSPYVPAYLNEEATFPKFDLAKAEQLLDEAGYKRGADGTRFKLRFTNPTQADSKIIAEILVPQLEAAGIDIDWQTFDQPTWTENVSKGDYDLTIYFVRYGPDPDAYSEHFHTGGPRNFTGYSNAEVDKLLDDARATADEQVRQTNYDAVQQHLVDDMPYINLFGQVRFSMANKTVQCLNIEPCGFDESMGWFGYRTAAPGTP